MSRASELADAITPSKDNVPELGDLLSAAAELRRLEAEVERLNRVNAELVEANEAQKNEWLAWDAKRKDLERDANLYRVLRIEACKPQARITVGIWGVDGNSHAGIDARTPEMIDKAIAALTSATKEQQK